MLHSRPFDPLDLDAISPQSEQFEDWTMAMSEKGKRVFEKRHISENAITIYDDFGVVHACGGVIHETAWRGSVWSFISSDVSPHELLGVARRFMWHMNALPYSRISASCLSSFEAGSRFLRILGFVEEGVMSKYDDLGRDHRLFART